MAISNSMQRGAVHGKQRRWLLPAAAAGVIFMIAGLALAQTPDSGRDLNVIIIVLDALRADHLGCYGYARKTSPFIDSLAAEGILFQRAMSNSSYTRESVSTLMTGLLPSSSPTGTGWFAKPNPATVNMGELFSNAGYATLFLTDAPVFATTPFGRGFAEKDLIPTKWGESGSGPAVSKRALAFVARQTGKKFMMYLHYIDPHAPYSPPDEYYLRFAKTRLPNLPDLMGDIRPNLPKFLAEGFGPGEVRFEDQIAGYDGEIALNDFAVATLCGGLKDLGVLDRTLIIFTSDHGEEFLDHGFVEHAWTVYNEVLHVPLILWRPGLFQPARVDARVSHCDLLPTLVRLLGLPCERTDLAGTPLLTRQGDQWTFAAPTKPIISEEMLQTRPQVRAVIQGDFKYIAAQKWLTPTECAEASKHQKPGIEAVRTGTFEGVDILGPPVYEALYNLASDPKEQHNILAESPDRALELRTIMETYMASCPKPIKGPAPEPQDQQWTPERQDQMKALGYF